jgi:2-oxoglutarate dehydrogenase E2 component (dihydrolipoamide succinyltransferase)
MAVEIVVPTLGESVTEATVSKWLKKEGDTVAVDEPLVELETDKVSLEVPAPATGVLASIAAPDGSEVTVGAVLGSLDGDGAAAAPAAAAPAAAEAAPALAAPAGGGSVELPIPQIGESVTEGTIAKWLKQVGDPVAVDEPLIELETDKASVEVPSIAAGTLTEQRVAEGEDVAVGAIFAVIGEGAAAAPSAPAPAAAAPQPAAAQPAAGDDAGMPSPAARKLIEDNGLDAASIPATGAKGNITKGDVLKYLEEGGAPKAAPGAAPAPKPAAPKPAAPPAPPAATITPAGALPDRPEDPRGEERVRMSRLRQVIAQRLKDAQNNAAMLTTYNECRMDSLMKLRSEYRDAFEKKHGVRLGFLSFFVKAAIIALKEIPAVNAEIYGDEIIYKNYYDIGVAVGTPQGLVVPVVRDADRMSFAEIENTIADYGKRARDGKLTIAEMTGGTFTISNGGVYGSLMSMPILNPPQSGILGMHTIQKRPIAVDGEVTIGSMMYLALSYDHRIVDGREAVTFLVRMKECLEDPQRLLIDV